MCTFLVKQIIWIKITKRGNFLKSFRKLIFFFNTKKNNFNCYKINLNERLEFQYISKLNFV